MNEKSKIADREEEILKFWQEREIFKKSLEKESPKGNFVFYEGPPTANAKPALHHLEARAFKDIIPRYKTMRGFHVPRKGGWDTHGLPVELQIEKKLDLTSKKDIEKYGVVPFNKACKDSVFEYIGEWEKFTDRIGYWMDKENAYYTFNSEYIEAVWNVLKNVDGKKLLYKDYKVLPWCPRCGTALSSHELAQGYQEDKDLSVYVKFKVVGEENTYLLAWTTTPWTLPGNVALAVGEGINYIKVKNEGDYFIFSKEIFDKRRDQLFNAGIVGIKEGGEIPDPLEIIKEYSGKDLVGLKYEPLFPYLKEKFGDKDPESFEKAYQVYGADFVNTEDGTGIVHTAVMYGQDDFELGTEVGLPKFHLVNEEGNFIDGCDFLSGRFVKEVDDKGKPTLAVDIIDDLKKRGLFFDQENIKHSYPHCWRCKTALIYYARDSWYIKVSSLRGELVKENEEINWVPSHIKEGRFGEWLREIKDWAISRERYWGTPLPIWLNSEGQKLVIGSIDDLKKHTKKSGNKYFVMRHGEAEHNKLNIVSNNPNHPHHLTEEGKAQVSKASLKLKDKKIDLIYCSPFVRTRETAEIIAEHIGYPKDKIVFDNRIREVDFGDLDMKSFSDFIKYEEESMKDLADKLPNGESYQEAKNRSGDFIYEIDGKHSNKNILIVTHGMFLEVLPAIVEGADAKKSKYYVDTVNPEVAGIYEYDFIPLPHNENYELDLHKPFIDEVVLVDEKGNEYKRTKEVMDVWFDSGSMPFAQDGLEGRNKMLYPADYISEAIDQTRGWFYTLHAIGVLMGKGKAFKNVVCLGHILDAEGKKMSKSIGNIVDPWVMMDKYGVDALRMWMYTVNQPGDSKNFDEKTVDELVKKIFNPLENILSFYEMYKDETTKSHNKSEHVLDKWIISSLNKLTKGGSEHLDKFEIFEAGRLVRDFVNDFSTWYIRRSRDRFKSINVNDKNDALATTAFVLLELSKYMAPFMPFFAEIIYQKLKFETDPESVHLCNWPKEGKVDLEILENMQEVRNTVSLALEKRMTANIKVRQPLAKLEIRNSKLENKTEYLELIRDEVNIKNIEFNKNLEVEVKLDTEITDELKKEGNARDFIRAVQDLRKTNNLTPDQKIVLSVETDGVGEEFLKSVEGEVKRPTNILEFVFEKNDGLELLAGEMKFKIQIK